MKKLFVSVPLKGRTEETIKASIKKMHKIAEVIFEEELEVIKSVWNVDQEKYDFEGLARHIDCMKDADYFIGVNNIYDTYCDVEASLLTKFPIPDTYVNAREICPDLFDGKHDVRGSWDFS